ncbi:MAG TPA: hypothetical protein VFW75_04530 [Acetobacteraceae bacterium]|nr:hypothetical protein [Acetobacteraceae bacterium]
MNRGDLVNKGLIWKGQPGSDQPLPANRTIIVSGLGRSGTSMVATLLAELGIISADDAYEETLDDREFLHLLKFRQVDEFRTAIAQRNQRSSVWGFKLPSIHGYLEPPDLLAFRNPRLVITVRDVVAVAERHAIAEHADPLLSFFEAADGLADLIRFLRAVICPTLLVSYEKAVSLHDEFITALCQFCGCPIDDALRDRLAAIIHPNKLEYARTARRRYDGNIDGMFNGNLVGWCREIGEAAPVRLDLLVDGEIRSSFLAGQSRDDLKRAGIGDGSHGFTASTEGLGIIPASILSVRVSGRTFEIPGSGKAAWEYWR